MAEIKELTKKLRRFIEKIKAEIPGNHRTYAHARDVGPQNWDMKLLSDLQAFLCPVL